MGRLIVMVIKRLMDMKIVKIQSYGEYVGTNIEEDLARKLSIDMIHICGKI